jgi:hypothetical protein
VKPRLVISAIWLTGFVLSLVILESYIHLTTSDGLSYLLPEDRLPSLQPLATLFGVYLGGILSFWFLKPFKASPSDRAENVRFWFATLCTLIFVGVILYFVAYTYLFGPGETTVTENIVTGSKIAGLLSFIVAPANFYYFGMKPGAGGEP